MILFFQGVFWYIYGELFRGPFDTIEDLYVVFESNDVLDWLKGE